MAKAMNALLQSIFTTSALLGHSRIPSPIKCVATAPSTSSDFLSAISAAPSTSTASFDLAEALCTDGSLPHGPWRHAFRALVTDETFLQHGWARAPFKLEEQWSFAVGAYTMADVARDITLLPPQFVAHGVEANGGIYNKPFSEGFTFSDVDAAMDDFEKKVAESKRAKDVLRQLKATIDGVPDAEVDVASCLSAIKTAAAYSPPESSLNELLRGTDPAESK